MKRMSVLLKAVITASVVFMFSPNLYAITLEEITANVKKVSVVTNGYQVPVMQTEIQAGAVTGELMTAVAPTSTSYVIVFDPGARFSTKDVIAEQTPSIEALPSATAGGDVRITMDIEKLLDSFTLMNNAGVGAESKEGRTYFKISGAYPDGSGTTAWVDPENWYISEISVKFFGQPFSRMALTYRAYGTIWLPSKVVIYHYADGTQVTQDFGEYQFAH